MTCTCDRNINININSLVDIEKRMKRLETLLGNIIMSQADLAAQLNANADQLEKVRAEVQNLLDVIAAEPVVTPELQAAADRVTAAVQVVDDLNPDA